jgi:hypothetical protein
MAGEPPVTPQGIRAELRAMKSKAERECKLLEVFEIHFRRQAIPTWPDHFAKYCGYSNKNALLSYQELRKVLTLYALRMAPDKMRGYTTRKHTPAVDLREMKKLTREAERLRARVEHGAGTTAELRAALARERVEHEETRRERDLARAMVDALDHYLAGRDAVVALHIEEKLHELAGDTVKRDPLTVQNVRGSGEAPGLRAIQGGKKYKA